MEQVETAEQAKAKRGPGAVSLLFATLFSSYFSVGKIGVLYFVQPRLSGHGTMVELI